MRGGGEAVARVTCLATVERDYIEKEQPVVVTGGATALPAFAKWTDAYLVDAIGDLRPLLTLADGRRARMRFSDYVGYLANPEAYASSTGPVYMTDLFLQPAFLGPALAELALDARCPLPRSGDVAERVAVFAGPKGTANEMHQDVFSPHVWVAQLRGEKAWRLCSPGDLNPETAKTTDAFDDADGVGVATYSALLRPGDLFYLPPNWWHQVRNESASVAIFGHFWRLSDARRWLAQMPTVDDDALRQAWCELWEAMLAVSAAGSRGER